ncbi:UDP-glucose 6-dehydrogenase 2 [Clostridia bacterium]|nr:UDP-glucose 6-dehydrogenase 2 [Clostridia bacterium]
MNIAVVGTGYVGLVTGACFSEYGNDVWCVDIDLKKIENLKKGIIPIFEPGLSVMVKENQAKGRLHFTTSLETALGYCEVCFIAVGTPMNEDGSADLRYVLSVAKQLGQFINRHTYIADKSTVPVGTASKVRETIQNELDARNSDITFDVVSIPEFLKEGSAVSDCMRPDRVIIGTDNDEVTGVFHELYVPFVRNNENFITMDVTSAEMTKYAANAMLATKISFMSEIAGICEKVGADVNRVRMGIGSDSRIGFQFIYPGCGYGGSCFPKDISALIHLAREYGTQARIMSAVNKVNDDQKHVLTEKIVKRFGGDLSGYTFAVWGLSFKPGTDDCRCAPSIVTIQDLTSRGARITAYDPQAVTEARERYLNGNERVSYADDKYEALKDADAMILVTEWKEFINPDFQKLKQLMKNPIVFDGRNQYEAKKMKQRGFEYYQIGTSE